MTRCFQLQKDDRGVECVDGSQYVHICQHNHVDYAILLRITQTNLWTRRAQVTTKIHGNNTVMEFLLAPPSQNLLVISS